MNGKKKISRLQIIFTPSLVESADPVFVFGLAAEPRIREQSDMYVQYKPTPTT